MRSLRASVLSLLCLCWVAFASAQDSALHAQPENTTTAEQDPYAAAIEQAIAAQGRGEFIEAHAWFARAHELLPNARTLRGLGVTSFQAGEIARAVFELEQALSHGVKPLEGELRQKTEALLSRALSQVGIVSLAVEPSNARVFVDGDANGTTDSRLILSPGPHDVRVTAQGHVDGTRRINVLPGSRETLPWALVPEVSAMVQNNVIEPRLAEVVPHRGAPVPLHPERHRRLVLAAWTSGALAAGGALTVVGLWFGARYRVDAIAKACRATELGECTEDERDQQAKDANLRAFERGLSASWVITGAAALSAGVALTWDYFGADRSVRLSASPRGITFTSAF